MSRHFNFRDPRAAFLAGALVAVLVLVLWFVVAGDEPPGPEGAPTEIAETAPPAPAGKPATRQQTPPSFDVVRISRGGTGVIAGRAAPGSRVEIYSNDVLIGVVDADARGEWVMILEQPLDSGPAELSLLARQFGQDPLQSLNIVVLSVPAREAPERPEEGVVALLTPRDGIGRSRILQKPGAPPVSELGNRLTIDTIDYGDQGRVIFAGHAAPRSRVALYLDNEFLGTARASDDGLWSFERDDRPAKGSHTVRIDQVIAEGDVQLRIEQPFEAGLPIDPARQEGKVVVLPGNSLWHIARRIYGSGFRYTLIFQENARQIRDPDLIYPGQLFDLPKPNAGAPSNR